VPELPSEEIPKGREGEEGLASWWPPALGRCATPREVKGVAGLGKRGEREWKRVVMVLVFVVGGVGGVGF